METDEAQIRLLGDGEPMSRSGYTLTLFRKDSGQCRLARDANLVTADQS